MIARVLLALAMVAAFAGTTVAQTCGGAGYDLSSITGIDMLLTTSWAWRIRACGIVNGTGAVVGTTVCAGQFCQSGTRVSSYDQQAASWFAVSGGVVQSLANGELCGTARRSNIFFRCNSTATTPFISSVTEPYTCTYNATVETAAACNPGNTQGVYVGATRQSTVCGGGFYDLTTLNSTDIFTNVGGTNYTIRVCGVVSNPACSTIQPTSVCQTPPGGVYNLATYRPAQSPVTYTVTSNGLNMIQQTGANCGSVSRYTNVSFACDPTAITPTILSVVEPSGSCRYTISVRTNQVCTLLGALSSSSGVARSSSSALSAVSSSSALLSSSAAASSSFLLQSSSSSSAAARSSSSSSVASSSTAASSSSAASSSAASSSAAAASSSSNGAGQSSSMIVIGGDSSSSSSALPNSPSSTGSGTNPPTDVNGAAAVRSSVFALMSAVIVAVVGQF